MQNGLVYLLQSLIDLYLITYVLRLGMQWVRADYRNPIVQFVLTVTNPLVLPMRRFVPPVYKIDTATLIIFVLLQWAAVAILTQLTCATNPGIGAILGLAIIRGARQIINVYFFLTFGYVLLSWVAQGAYNPSIAMLSSLLRQLAEPVLSPFRRLIPPIAGLDLSPIALLLLLGAAARMLYGPAQQIAGGYFCPLAAIL